MSAPQIEEKRPGNRSVAGYVCITLAALCFYAEFTLLAFGFLFWFCAIVSGVRKWERSKAEAVVLLTLCAGVITWYAGRYFDWWPQRGRDEANRLARRLLENPRSDLANEITDARVWYSGGLDGTHLFRFRATAAAVRNIVKQAKLELLNQGKWDSDSELSSFWNEPPWWWKPENIRVVVYHRKRSPDWPIKSVLLYDETSQVVHYKWDW
ncbi:MAG: hypothetical protein HZC54_05055 [Verrucomicrobia bacterium]|nr:hypothetical protein [Verrucomicrobiota bacterium]